MNLESSDKISSIPEQGFGTCPSKIRELLWETGLVWPAIDPAKRRLPIFWQSCIVKWFPDIEDLLYRTYSFCSYRHQDIVAARSYDHNSWAQAESTFLRSKEGLAIKHSIMANSLSLIRDHGTLRSIIEICHQNMLPEESFANLVTMYKRVPPILSQHDVETPVWATSDPETVGIYNKLHAGVVVYIEKKFGDHGARAGIDRHPANNLASELSPANPVRRRHLDLCLCRSASSTGDKEAFKGGVFHLDLLFATCIVSVRILLSLTRRDVCV